MLTAESQEIPKTTFARIGGIALALLVLIAAVTVLYLPADWLGDLRPAPDAVEYAVTAQRLAQGEAFVLPMPGHDEPSRYPFGFPALLAPAYWLPGAEVRSGIYGVIALSALGIVLVYLLGSRLWNRAAGLIAALALLILPQYIAWNRLVMSETATATLVAAIALLLWHASTAPNRRRRYLLLGGASVIVGVAMLLRLNNVAFAPALLAGVIAYHVATRRQLHPLPTEEGRPKSGREGFASALRTLLPPLSIAAIGPVLALVTLGVYSWKTFGSPLDNGYRYWVPEWYANPRLTFAFTYAFNAPAMRGDPTITPNLSNIVYYARSMTGLLPTPSSNFLSRDLAVVALVGALAAIRDQRPAARALGVFAITLGVVAALLFVGYFYADVRFLAPLAPLMALAIAGGCVIGLRLIRVAFHQHHLLRALPCAIVGAVILAITAQAVFVAAAPVHATCYTCKRIEGRPTGILYQPAPELATVAAYNAQTTPPSILITDILPPLLGAAGLTEGRMIVPLTLGEYWGKAPLRDTTSITDRQRLILDALRDGVPVYIDAYSITPVSNQGSGDMERFLQAHNARLETAYSAELVTIYRLVALP